MALRRMNRMHGRFDIKNEEFLYVLSTFVIEPIRWNERFGWRPLTEKEKAASFAFWREVGTRMNIKGIPATLAEFMAFSTRYEQEQFRFSEPNWRVGEPTMRMFLRKFLGPMWRLGLPFMTAVMDDLLLQGMGLKRPPAPIRWLVVGSLKARAAFLRLMPARRRPVVRTALRRPSYPEGYHTEELGTRE